MSAVFVTATGTEVGKTFVSCGLIRALRRAGRAVEVLKPTQSGFDPSAPQGSDAALLLEAAGEPVTADTIARVAPFRYAAALAPPMAAAREGKVLTAAAVIAVCRTRLVEPREGVLVIEGAGGVMSPLDGRATMLDLAGALGVPVLLVAGSYLGTISHTLTAVSVLRGRGLAVAAIVVSETEDAGVPLEETAEAVRGFLPDVAVLALPRLGAAARHPVFAELATRV